MELDTKKYASNQQLAEERRQRALSRKLSPRVGAE